MQQPTRCWTLLGNPTSTAFHRAGLVKSVGSIQVITDSQMKGSTLSYSAICWIRFLRPECWPVIRIHIEFKRRVQETTLKFAWVKTNMHTCGWTPLSWPGFFESRSCSKLVMWLTRVAISKQSCPPPLPWHPFPRSKYANLLNVLKPLFIIIIEGGRPLGGLLGSNRRCPYF